MPTSKPQQIINQRASYNRISELNEAGFSYGTIASAITDKGLSVTPEQVKNYYELSSAFADKQYLLKKDVAQIKEPVLTFTQVIMPA